MKKEKKDMTETDDQKSPVTVETDNQKKLKSKRKPLKIVLFSLLGVIVALIIAGAIYIYQAVEHPGSLFTVVTPDPKVSDGMVSVTPALENETPSREHVNILLLGIDQDYKTYAREGGDYHTDSIIVLAVNFKENTVDMISLPRDTFTHVPGVKGIYKLNAAINCGGGKTDAGFKKVCEAASWMLGGINVDYYYAFELGAVEKIGNLIGGVDFDVDMSYRGNSGTYYEKGTQHLDGTGIYDYMRARKNATGEAGDRGRMNRGKAMLKAVFQKLKEQDMLTQLPQLIGTVNEGTYTNLTLQQTIALANFAYQNIDMDEIGSYTMSGGIRSALGWNFWFIDQEYRTELIQQIYGVEVPPQQYVSYDYANWLDDYGFKTTRYLVTADAVMEFAQTLGIEGLTAEQRESYDAVTGAYQKTQIAYGKAALTLDGEDNRVMKEQREALHDYTQELAELVDYPNELVWSVKSAWYEDASINEVNVNFQ